MRMIRVITGVAATANLCSLMLLLREVLHVHDAFLGREDRETVQWPDIVSPERSNLKGALHSA